MTTKLYAAYGSNLNINQMGRLCPTAKPIAKSWLFDYRLVFQGNKRFAHATVIPEMGKEVPIVIWEISEKDEVELDKHLGVHSGYYNKEYMNVEVDGEFQKVLIYIMPQHDFGTPSRMYLDTVTRGYLEFNFPTTVLEEAIVYSCQNSIIYEKKEETNNGN